MALDDAQEKEIRAQLKRAEEELESARKDAKTPADKAELKKLADDLAQAKADLEKAKKSGADIKAASEESVHAVLERCDRIEKRLSREAEEPVRWGAF